MKKILEFFAEKNRWAILVMLLLLLLGGWFLKTQRDSIKDLKRKYQTEVNLRNALTDSVHYYQNKEQQWVAEKLTIQADLKELEKMNGQLTAEQRRLIAKVNEVNKENAIIAAALIQANFKIDSLLHAGDVIVDTTNKTVEFIERTNPNINYDLKVFNVTPYPIDTKPKLIINNLFLPNEQFVEFHWKNEKKKGYPIAFSVTNSNEYVKVNDINSYAIPELYKPDIDPTGWQKIGQWFLKNGKIVGYVAGGVIIGAGGTYILMK